jgi:threonine/homoserine/homoserine lactone efflux protein
MRKLIRFPRSLSSMYQGQSAWLGRTGGLHSYPRLVPHPETLAVFGLACVGLVLLPGPAVVYIVTRGVVHGRRGGLVSMAGVESGNLVQVIAATAGLAAVIASSAEAFNVVKYLGAAYLIFLGVRTFLGSDAEKEDGAATGSRPERRLYLDGLVVGIFNPKLALFLLAFLPQFIDPDVGPVWLQTLTLGLVFSGIAMVGDSLWALSAATAGGRLRRWLRGRRLARTSGIVYLGLGAFAALSPGQPKS